MGLDDREYVRNDPRLAARWSPAADGGVTRTIILVTIAVFLGQLFTVDRRNGVSLVTGWLEMDHRAIEFGQVWRMLTYAFCHSTRGLWHILLNMFVLWWAGRAVESLYGGREFLRFYLVAAIASSLAYVIITLAGGGGIGAMVGASGCTMACFAVFAAHYPHAQVRLMGILPVEARWLLVAYVFMDMIPVLQQLSGRGGNDGIAHSAHLGGLAFGLWYKWSGVRLGNAFGWWDRWRDSARASREERAASNANVRIYEPTREELEERVDALLAKIQEHGEASLTDAEREFLKEASRRYHRG